MSDEDLPSLDSLSRQIGEAKQRLHPPEPEIPASSGVGKAMRLGVEFASGVLVGCLVGYFLDRWLDTGPFFLMVCLALGSAAGFRTMIRSTQQDSGDSDSREQ